MTDLFAKSKAHFLCAVALQIFPAVQTVRIVLVNRAFEMRGVSPKLFGQAFREKPIFLDVPLVEAVLKSQTFRDAPSSQVVPRFRVVLRFQVVLASQVVVVIRTSEVMPYAAKMVKSVMSSGPLDP